ncbi:hypothetical protein SISSUDRAFT_625778 [Sistotremastrum suecicum HHB10207 ss-3]|uniref:Uncharacterized protein n=1 Tax=Sistotremastrum suecicum HHB10207 ss-3 TaxID=1314776 RepID=A0A166EJQ8_9AGAM|nr:hypothetical protein SISSUDRAFT_625778 [Sistotremastrum suecicum HHB10207 ss-3]
MCWVNGYPSRSACVAGLCSLPLGESLVRVSVAYSSSPASQGSSFSFSRRNLHRLRRLCAGSLAARRAMLLRRRPVQSAVVESLMRVRAIVIQPHLPLAGLRVLWTKSLFLFGMMESLVIAVDLQPGLNRLRCSLSFRQNLVLSFDTSESLVRAPPHPQPLPSKRAGMTITAGS